MRRALVVLSVLSALAAPGGACAHSGHLHKVLGTVTAVDAAHIEVRSQERLDLSLAFDEQTKFLRGKARIEPVEIRPGERVAVTYAEKEGKKTAQEIRLAEKPAD